MGFVVAKKYPFNYYSGALCNVSHTWWFRAFHLLRWILINSVTSLGENHLKLWQEWRYVHSIRCPLEVVAGGSPCHSVVGSQRHTLILATWQATRHLVGVHKPNVSALAIKHSSGYILSNISNISSSADILYGHVMSQFTFCQRSQVHGEWCGMDCAISW